MSREICSQYEIAVFRQQELCYLFIYEYERIVHTTQRVVCVSVQCSKTVNTILMNYTPILSCFCPDYNNRLHATVPLWIENNNSSIFTFGVLIEIHDIVCL